MIGAPLAAILMNGGNLVPDFIRSLLETQQQLPFVPVVLQHLHFAGYKTASDPGVWQTFLTLGVGYFCFMLVGAFGYRLPPTGWRPDGWTPPNTTAAMITQHHVHLDNAHKTKQFWLIWAVLALNVSAGIGVIGMASPMLQEIGNP